MKRPKIERGNVILAINGRRSFAKYGMKFMIQNIPSGAKERKDGYKYCLYLVTASGFLKLVHDKITLEVPKFKTIKDAQRWVWFHSGEGFFVDTF